MKISLVTGHPQDKLVYVLRQFLLFTALDIEATVENMPVSGTVSPNSIAYTDDFAKVQGAAVYIYRAADPGADNLKIKAGIYDDKEFFAHEDFIKAAPLIKYSGGRVEICFDIFAQVFYQLSCSNEVPRGRDAQESRPNVNILFLILEGILAQAFGLKKTAAPRYPGGKDFAVILTHDVDAPRKTVKERLKHLWHGAVRTKELIGSGRFACIPAEALETLKKVVRSQEYNNIGYLCLLEEKLGVRSSFNIFAMNEKNKSGAAEQLYNPEYDISRDKEFVKTLDELSARGFDIGLHGSYFSGRDPELFKEELDILERTMRKKIAGGRQHFLNYSPRLTPKIYQDAGIQYDTSVGFRDMNGFRAGSCLPYYLYCDPDDKETDVLEMPLVIMDGVLFDRRANTKESAWGSVVEMLERIRAAKGCGSVVWHQRVFNNKDYPFWEDIYCMLIKWVRDNNGGLYTPSSLNSFWRGKENRHVKYRAL